MTEWVMQYAKHTFLHFESMICKQLFLKLHYSSIYLSVYKEEQVQSLRVCLLGGP